MKLLSTFLAICSEVTCFRQERTAKRARRLLLSVFLCVGRKWITRMLSATNRDQQDWSGDYKVFSRAPWDPRDLFRPAIVRSLDYFDESEPIALAIDETNIKRGGQKVQRSKWLRDPLSPPFHVNFVKGIRFMQVSALLPFHRDHDTAARGVPVSFEPVEIPAKPGKRASDEEKAAYEKVRKENNMSKQALRQMQAVRESYDQSGACDRDLLFSGDGGFCNKTIFRNPIERCSVIARCRKDAVLCMPANDPNRPRLVYCEEKFTPTDVREDENTPIEEDIFMIGGNPHEVRFKEVKGLLWRGGAGRRHLRLIILNPIAYRRSPNGKLLYRQWLPCLTDNLDLPAHKLVQVVLDRWQIEVNHRDEKQHVGLQDPQVWNSKSVDRIVPFMVAAYSFLLLAAIEAYGPERTNEYLNPPKWQRKRTRPSCLDLIALLRKEALDNPAILKELDIDLNSENCVLKAVA